MGILARRRQAVQRKKALAATPRVSKEVEKPEVEPEKTPARQEKQGKNHGANRQAKS